MLEILNLIKGGKKHSFTGEEVQKLLASDGDSGDSFGITMAISSDGSVLVIGAYGDGDNGATSGSAYVFTKESNGSYTQSQKLLASDGAAQDYFGRSLTISSDSSVIVVGAYRDDDIGADSGSAYVFTKQSNGSYTESQKLLASDGAAQDYFGYAVSINSDGTVIVVGAYYDDDNGKNSGSAYVFTKQTNGSYVQSQKLTANDGVTNDYFGFSVAVSSDSSVIIVGAYGVDDNGSDSGSVYVFTVQPDGSYVQSQKLTADDGAAGDYFGISLSISGDGSVVVVGAYGDDDIGNDSGSVYVFTKQSDGDYAQSQKLTTLDGAAGDYFSRSVAISSDGSVITAGAYNDDDKGSNSGSAYVFTKQSDGIYVQSQKLLASDGAAQDYFGYSVSISSDGSIIVVGAYGDDDTGSNSGSAYVF